MEFSLLLNTIKSGWSIVYIEGSQVTGYCFQKNSLFLLLKINFVKLNSADPYEMPHHAAFHLDLHCLPKYPFRVWGLKRVKDLFDCPYLFR